MSDQEFQGRPGIPTRASVASVSETEAIMQILKSNPHFSFAQAEEYFRHQTSTASAPVVPEPTWVPETPPPALFEPVPPNEPTSDINYEERITPMEDPPLARGQGRSWVTVDDGPFVEKVEKEPVAQVQPPELKPDVRAQKQVDEPGVDKQAAVKPPVTKTGSPSAHAQQPHREEFEFPLEPTAPDRILLETDDLVGFMSTGAADKEVMRFFNSVKRDRENRPIFTSQAEEEKYQKLFSAMDLTPPLTMTGKPAFQGALERDDVTWEQTVRLPDGSRVSPVVNRSKGLSGVRATLRRRRGTGATITLWLPATGITITYRAPKESEFCDFDIQLASEQAKIGMNTYGLLLSASSGIYMKHMIEFALSFAIETTFDCEGRDLKTALVDVIDIDDYWLVLLGPLIAKFPSGVPWKLVCPGENCNVEREERLSLARCIRLGDGLFTDLQLALYQRQRGKKDYVVSSTDTSDYRKELFVPKSALFRYEQMGLTIEFGRSTIGEFIDATERWAEEINIAATSAISENSTEALRAQHIRLTAETRRLTRYAARVKSIRTEEIVDGEVVETVETNPDEIYATLEDLSSDRVYVLSFENAIAKYNEDCRLAVFGYMAKPCTCGSTLGEEDGPFRGIVTISPDRVFFAVSRVVSGIQRQYLAQFGGIG